jgi:hypothetical protein
MKIKEEWTKSYDHDAPGSKHLWMFVLLIKSRGEKVEKFVSKLAGLCVV